MHAWITQTADHRTKWLRRGFYHLLHAQIHKIFLRGQGLRNFDCFGRRGVGVSEGFYNVNFVSLNLLGWKFGSGGGGGSRQPWPFPKICTFFSVTLPFLSYNFYNLLLTTYYKVNLNIFARSFPFKKILNLKKLKFAILGSICIQKSVIYICNSKQRTTGALYTIH